MGNGECTMDPRCSPNFVLLQGQKDAEKFRNKGQNFWCTLGRGGGSLQRTKLGVDLVSLREAQIHQLFFLGRPIRAGVGRQCQVWGLCDWLGIPNAHIYGNVLQNVSHTPMAAVRLNQIHTIQSCSFRIPSHILEHTRCFTTRQIGRKCARRASRCSIGRVCVTCLTLPPELQRASETTCVPHFWCLAILNHLMFVMPAIHLAWVANWGCARHAFRTPHHPILIL